MQQNRREFLKQAALTAGAIAAGPLAGVASAHRVATRLAIQLYSVRDDMKKDPKGTLTALARMGYKNVEHANYVDRKFYGYDPATFKKLLDDLGLTMPSGHTQLKEGDHWNGQDFTDAWKQTVEDARIAGQGYVICPWLDESLRTDAGRLKRWMDVFNKSGELCRASGLQFGYHNHDFEFKDRLDGKLLYDIILGETDPKLVAQQLDIGNMMGGGAKPMDVLNAHPGRFALMHVKDVIPAKGAGEMNDPYDSTVLGQGILGTEAVVRAAVAQGTTQLTIEQESYQGRRPLDDARKDLEVMHHWGY
ncbi:MAG TPA: sugar phosphate isomerase/epimerase [Dinghuibacter sp.]|uniref:sugar phosphate isomerase/epimerase family protein n=1 Tax=Dinghuibacter sp. TaxID=2024697 RepID=UPI002C83F320|nr:sugar phosphate isomerase/epimerase [Dinghuibacter sp.]HTJ10895.1 sugar phosphate isomerase/epimerase [Dinghuibacter sp.]